MPDTKGTIVLAAGGTGGHMFPAQALAEELSQRGYKIVLVTDDRGKAYTDRFPNTEIVTIPAATFAGANPIKRLQAAVQIFSGIVESYGRLGRLRPKVVIGFGGYPSLPTMVAAILRGIPRAIHDPNAVLGRVNKVMANHVDLIGAAFDNMEGLTPKQWEKTHVVGNPVRANIVAARKVDYAAPQPGEAIKLLVFGGSQGAQVFSDVMPAAIEKLPEAIKAKLHVTQQARAESMDEVQREYDEMGVRADVAPFFGNLPERLAEAHLVIARAGASTVTELGAVGRPSILVPLPTAMDDHQTVNARALTAPGGAWLMPQDAFTVDAVADKLRSLLSDPMTLNEAAEKAYLTGRPDATKAFADLIEDLIRS